MLRMEESMTSPFLWRDSPLVITMPRNPNATKLHNGLQTPTNHRGGITVTGRVQGQADALRRDAIKRAISMAPDAGCYFAEQGELTRRRSVEG